MLTKEVIVADQLEKHDNPIAELVHLACRFSSEIYLAARNKQINAKSIMGVMSAYRIGPGEKVEIFAKGNDAQEAILAVEAFLV